MPAFQLTYQDYLNHYNSQQHGSEGGDEGPLTEQQFTAIPDADRWGAVGGQVAILPGDPRYNELNVTAQAEPGRAILVAQGAPDYRPDWINDPNRIVQGEGWHALSQDNFSDDWGREQETRSRRIQQRALIAAAAVVTGGLAYGAAAGGAAAGGLGLEAAGSAGMGVGAGMGGTGLAGTAAAGATAGAPAWGLTTESSAGIGAGTDAVGGLANTAVPGTPGIIDGLSEGATATVEDAPAWGLEATGDVGIGIEAAGATPWWQQALDVLSNLSNVPGLSGAPPAGNPGGGGGGGGGSSYSGPGTSGGKKGFDLTEMNPYAKQKLTPVDALLSYLKGAGAK